MESSNLLALLRNLRANTAANRKDVQITARQLAQGYFETLSSAPQRSRPYFSATRIGTPPVDPFGRRKEERLAMAWFKVGNIDADGKKFKILDYQFPLKSTNADTGIGKVDLLAQSETDKCLAVIELKVGSNREDRRIAVLEGLIYSAIVEANAQVVVQQLSTVKGIIAKSSRPKILIVAPSAYWASGIPSQTEIQALVEQLQSAIPIEISLLKYEVDEDQDYGLSGQFQASGLDGNDPRSTPIALYRV